MVVFYCGIIRLSNKGCRLSRTIIFIAVALPFGKPADEISCTLIRIDGVEKWNRGRDWEVWLQIETCIMSAQTPKSGGLRNVIHVTLDWLLLLS